MPLILPDFENRKCFDVEYCGLLVRKGAAQEQRFRDLRAALLAPYKTPRGTAYIQIRGMKDHEPAEGEKHHLHIDLVSPNRLLKSAEPNATIEDIQNWLAPYFGSEFEVHLRGDFLVPTSELPPFIRTAFTATVADSVQVRMVAATLDVRGAPINRISWRLRDKNPAIIILEADLRMELNEGYFIKGLDLLEEAYRAFIVKEQSDA